LGEEDHAADRFLKFPLAYFSGFGSSDEGLAELILRVGPSEFFGRLILERPVRATLIRHYTLVARPQWSYEKEGFLVVGMIGIH